MLITILPALILLRVFIKADLATLCFLVIVFLGIAVNQTRCRLSPRTDTGLDEFSALPIEGDCEAGPKLRRVSLMPKWRLKFSLVFARRLTIH